MGKIITDAKDKHRYNVICNYFLAGYKKLNVFNINHISIESCLDMKDQWLNDYKAGITYLVIDVKQSNGKTVILAESHTAQGTPAIGFDVIILNGDGTIPKSEKWGENAWTYNSLEHATAVFQTILEKVPIPCRKRHLKKQSSIK